LSLFDKNLLIVIGEMLTHMEKDLAHTVFHQSGGKFRDHVSCSQDRENLLTDPDQRDKIAFPPMGADYYRVVPRKDDLCQKIDTRGNHADKLRLRSQELKELFRAAVKSHVPRQRHRDPGIFRVLMDISGDLPAAVLI